MKKISITLLTVIVVTSSFSQNIGIGTTTPTEKLHVVGNIKGDTLKPNAIKLIPNAGIGKILTSDATGNASWQSSSTTTGNTGYGVWGDCATNGNISEYQPVSDTAGEATDQFGVSSAISGNFAIVGAFQDDGSAGVDQGSASIYQFNGVSWMFMQKLTDANGAANDYYGYNVAISGNYAIVGAPGDDGVAGTEQGSVSIYQFNGSNWVLMQKIFDATGGLGDYFGLCVGIAGNIAVVGAYLDDGPVGVDQGSISTYQFNGTGWVLMQKITDATGAINDHFGGSVAISGNLIIAGAYDDDGVGGADQGSASIYQFNGTNWVLMQKLLDVTGAGGDKFGFSVSISGITVIIGAYSDDGSAATNQGSATIFRYNGTSWIQIQKLADPAGAFNDHFGYDVSISGNLAIVGALNDDGPAGADQGTVSIFQFIGLSWQKLQLVTDPAANPTENFGISVAIDGSRFIIGAHLYFSQTGKALFGKVN